MINPQMENQKRRDAKMKLSPTEELCAWADYTDKQIAQNKCFPLSYEETMNLRNLIGRAATEIHCAHPTYEAQLKRIEKDLLYLPDQFGYRINLCLFGQLYMIVHYVNARPQNCFWSNIHPRIIGVAQAEYVDGYFDSAAEKALREVETYLRELFSQHYSGQGEPKEIATIKDRLLNDDTVYEFDRQTPSGKNYFEGVKALFDNAFKAYRNPASHRNITISQREAAERIMLASQLMYVLDEKKKA